MKVLVVEHSSNSEISLGTGLESLGYAVDVVADGTEAITYASCNNYDVIIMDLMLPKASILLALHEIRELDRDVDILILSTPEQIHDRVTALIQGADDYLVKPFSVDDLNASIQSLLRRKANSEPGRD
jgi:DNA-binding response OmpR family regulator